MSTRALPVDVTIGGKSYRFAAPADQVERLHAIATRVDAVLNEIKTSEPMADRDRQTILCCLTLMSDLADTEQRNDAQVTAVTQFHRMLADRLQTLIPQ
jgi:cell division protein ZapA (FtsZ GTPase activity inhibitor)